MSVLWALNSLEFVADGLVSGLNLQSSILNGPIIAVNKCSNCTLIAVFVHILVCLSFDDVFDFDVRQSLGFELLDPFREFVAIPRNGQQTKYKRIEGFIIR